MACLVLDSRFFLLIDASLFCKKNEVDEKQREMDVAFDIYRIHWARENNELRKLKYANHFNRYFEYNCTTRDIYSLREESNPDGLFELLGYVKDWILRPFGYDSDRLFSYTNNHQRFYIHSPSTKGDSWAGKSRVLTKNVYAIVLDTTAIRFATPARKIEWRI